MAGGPGGTHPRSCRCIDCGRYCTCTNCPQNTWVAYREVVSDTNNNLGRDFAACDVIHPNGRKCRYYRFKDDRQGDEPFVNSPSPDPPPSVPHWQSLGDASQILASTASQMSRPRGNLACSRPKCGKPANMKCYSSKCRAHCIQDGGCGFSDHAPKNLSTQPSLAFPVSTQPSLAFPVSTQPNLTFPLSTHPNASSTSNSTLPNTLSPSSLNTLSSNSPTFFSEVVDGRDYITDKRRTKRDAVDEAKAVSRKANTEVSVFFWVNSLVPTPCQIQGNVYDGHFTISREVLDTCSFAGSSFHVYRVGMRRWLNASVDYVVKLSTMLKADGCPVLLLRDPSVTDCDGLDAILSSGASEMDWMSNPDRLKHSSRRRDFLQKLDTMELAVAAKVTAKVKKASSTSKASSSKSRTSPKHSTAKRRKASSPLLTPPSKKTTKRLKRPSPTLPSPSRTLVPFDLNQRFTASPSPDRHLIYAGPADAGSLSPNPSSPQSIISVSDHEIVVKQEDCALYSVILHSLDQLDGCSSRHSTIRLFKATRSGEARSHFLDISFSNQTHHYFLSLPILTLTHALHLWAPTQEILQPTLLNSLNMRLWKVPQLRLCMSFR
ncbi:hypothetical protein BT96DRAFT_1004365 [Gymnopus androsaceus JB14]|uniref:Uncharacterized protein n=1 Tax=Gymnopus androsaceus JB14 TaxID=1447944 RepID=A0A6A4GR79_9AGAR|nr:hypothetical protein BT96DRAFT_1004365 [Gymnopus androsaceus JB14]